MKKVVLVRHAKTISHGYDQDFDRTLTERGINDAERISAAMLAANIRPDLVIASPAVRTTQTAQIFAGTLQYPAREIRYEKKLYSGLLAGNLLNMIRELEDFHEVVMVVGHNPTMFYYNEYLLNGFSLDVPTCATMVAAFDIQRWEELQPHSGRMIHRWIPDLL